MTEVNGATQLYAVLGDPVEHSLSPRIQNAAFRETGRNAVYVALRVRASSLAEVLEGFHAAGVQGLNLTSPLKEKAYQLATATWPSLPWSGVEQEAEWSGAINTLRWESGGWKGHGTDGIGFSGWIQEEGVDLRGKRVLVAGAGGAARAIVMTIAQGSPGSVHIVNRSAAHAETVAQRARDLFSSHVTASSLSERQEPGGWNVLVRALPAEAISAVEERWWREHDPDAIVLDLNYGPRSEPARALAMDCGLRYLSGEGLLVHQGAASFEYWTGQKGPVQTMRAALEGSG